MIPTNSITDYERQLFLEKLHGSQLILSEWEQRFISGYWGAARRGLWFTPGRRESADKMRMKYGAEPDIAMPFPLAESTPSQIAPADAGCCEFIMRDEGRQRRCNDPAEYQRQSGFRYCENHADEVKADVKRRGIKMTLFPYRKEIK